MTLYDCEAVSPRGKYVIARQTREIPDLDDGANLRAICLSMIKSKGGIDPVGCHLRVYSLPPKSTQVAKITV